MKNIVVSILSCFVVFFVATPVVYAVNVLDPACNDNPEASVCKDNNPQNVNSNSIYGPNGILARVATILAVIVGVACVIVIIIGGIRYVLSGGDSQQTASAKNTILYAIIGLVITISARSILLFVLRRIE